MSYARIMLLLKDGVPVAIPFPMNSAIEIQRAIGEAIQALPPEERIQFQLPTAPVPEPKRDPAIDELIDEHNRMCAALNQIRSLAILLSEYRENGDEDVVNAFWMIESVAGQALKTVEVVEDES